MYKKYLTGAVLGASLLVPVQADTLLGLYVGAQAWHSDVSGGFANGSTVTDFDFDKETNSNLYVALEHPVPLLPNIKIRRQNLNISGATTLDQDFTFAGQTYVQTRSLASDGYLDSTDYVVYYEVFDNDLLSLDLGLNAKDFDGQISVRDVDDTSITSAQSFRGIVPLLYSRVQIGTPVGGLGFTAEGSFLAIDDSSLYDYQAAVTYQWLDNLAVDLTFQLGYRVLQLELDDVDDLYTDMEFKGPFAGVEVHF
ncbi:TIGR04219 family outer membrane beta-barrel protein [Lacimicrobium alkaliphilum]|uniref:Membrane protein n=1 Tax=Lacimicrobium alkaliphilum TaxID=1526571 RepID=A0ABQ1RMK9_9ALTE|nr:TIGR04219 family outer membrane beta-barrel protein [Lacimicrobium alkaliphilum]GGD72959.1 membrane protein [Lacimicrobium alkaliphilum]